MSREETNQIRYVIALIAEFAKKFNLGQRQAYNYLKRFKGIDYLMSFYDVLHTQSFEDAIHDISIICERNGGTLKYQIKTKETIELTDEQIDMMKEDVCAELIAILMKDRHCTMSEAIDMLITLTLTAVFRTNQQDCIIKVRAIHTLFYNRNY